MNAVITVIGKDATGIIARVSGKCSERNINIIDITQKVMGDTFAMIMMTDISDINIKFSEFIDELTELGEKMGLSIHVMQEDIFNSMHRI